MEINIFSSENIDRRIALRRHFFTLLIAVLLNLAFWFFQSADNVAGQPSDRLFSTLIDIVSTIIETIILMEASFAMCRLVIRLFWNAKYSYASILAQNIVLLIAVILISAAISFTYALIYPESSLLSWDVFLCDSLVAYFLSSVFFMTYLTNRYMKEKALAQQVTIDKLKLKTDNHFVFNSLATLGNLIQTDPDSAVEFNSSMSRMYRYIVSKGDASVVSLSEELDFMEEYRKNMEQRHRSISIVVDENMRSLRSFIPPLALQGLVENAVKHNRHSSDTPLEISIRYDELQNKIVVSNNTLALKSNYDSSKSGLSTLNLRYQAICGEGIVVSKSDSEFKVLLPVIKHSDLS